VGYIRGLSRIDPSKWHDLLVLEEHGVLPGRNCESLQMLIFFDVNIKKPPYSHGEPQPRRFKILFFSLFPLVTKFFGVILIALSFEHYLYSLSY